MGGLGEKNVWHMGRHRKSIGAHGKTQSMKKRPWTWPEGGGNISRHVMQHMNGNASGE